MGRHRSILLAALALALLAAFAALRPERLPPPRALLPGPPPPRAAGGELTATIETFIRTVNPDVPAERAARLARTTVEVARASHLDPLLLAGIMAQESRFHADVQSCHARGCDLGVAQVNWETWARALALDRHRLIHDDAYNLAVAATILTDLRVRFRREGPGWWTRYHDARPARRADYAERVRSHQPVLLGTL